MKSLLRSSLLSIIAIAFIGNVLAQPVWVPTTPSVGTTGPLTIPVNYGIDRAGTVYIVVYNYYLDLEYPSSTIKNWAIAGPNVPPNTNGRVATAVITISGADIGMILHTIFDVINVNKAHTLYFVAEDGSGVLQSEPVRINASTKPCPEINLFTFFGNTGECVNIGATGMFQVAPLGLMPTGVLKGTKWTIDWGDGSTVWSYTSIADDDLPGIQTHTYTNLTTCNYVGTWTVQNPCGKFSNGSTVFVVHGRDIPEDGDGELRMAESVTGTPDIIYLCEGYEYNITLYDASTWNCQDPDVPAPLTAKPNLDPRTIQFIYGETPTGTIMNTIHGDVKIGGTNTANSLNGYVGPVIPGLTSTGQETEVITIPATCLAGDQFYVYLKNWNKCNPFVNENLDYVYEDFIIEIIDAPDPPIVTTPQTYCYGSVPTTISATPNNGMNTLNWYADSLLTIQLDTGLNLTHGKTDVGTYYFWVTETSGVNGCEGPPAKITMVINPIPNKPNISVTGPTAFCFDNGATTVTLTASPITPPDITSYQWYKDGSPFNTNVSNTFSQLSHSGSYTLQVYGIAPSYCPSPLSDPVVVAIHPLATSTDPSDRTVCETSATSFSVTVGPVPCSVRWQRSSDNGSTWVDITGGSVPNDGCTYSNYTSATLNISNAQYSMNNYQYRVKLTTTTGNCVTYSNAGVLTVNPLATITAHPANTTVCELSNASFSVTATVPPPSTITNYQWQRRPGGGGYSNINGTLDGGIYSGFNTNTLTINNTPYLVNYTYRVIITTTGGCSRTSNAATLTVNPLADITAQPANRNICAGENTTFTVTDDGNPAVTARQWQISTDGGSTWNNLSNGGVYSGVTSNTLTLTNVPVGYNSYQYRCILTTNGPCTITSNPGLLTVHPLPIDRTVSAADAWLCYNTATNINLTASENLTVYQLRIGTTNVGSSQTGNGSNLAFPTGNLTSNTTFNIYAARTTTIGASTRTCYLQMSNTPLVTVNPNLTMTNLTHPNICIDGTIDLPAATPSGGSGTYTYNWTGTGGYTNNVQNPAPFSPVLTGPHSYDVTVTDEGFRLASSDNTICSVSDNISFTVNPLPVNKVIAPAASPICYNTSTSINIPTSEVGVRYDVYKSVGSVFVGSANGDGGTVSVSTGILLTNTDFYAVAVNTTTSCTRTLNTVTVAVNPRFQNAQLYNDTSICNNTSADFRVILTGGTSPYTINYAKNGTPQTPLSSYVSGTNVNTGSLTTNTTYTLTSVTDFLGCPVENLGTPILITVGSTPSSATLTGSGDACVGTSSTIKSEIIGGASPYILNITGYPLSPVNNYISNTNIDLGILSTGPHTYTLTSVTDACGNTIPSPPLPVGYTITINPIPDASTTVNNTPSICNDGTTDIVLHSDVPGSDFIWTVSYVPAVTWQPSKAPAGGTQLNGDGVSISQNLAHIGLDPVTVTYTITPRGPGATACVGAPVTRNVVVNPTAVITSPATAVVCDNTPLGYTATSSTAGASFAWTRAVVPGIANPAGNGNTALINESLDNTTPNPVNVTYVITPSYGSCPGTPFNLVVTVNPTPVITSPATAVVCDNTPLGYTATSSTAGASFAWTRAVVPGIANPAGNGNTALINESLDNTTPNPVNVTYVITPSYGSCPGTPFNLVVTVNPTAIITSPATAVVCDNTPLGYTATSSTAGASFAWTRAVVPGIANPAGNGNTALINESLDNTTPNPVNVTYVITPSYGSCPGTPFNLVVTVNPTAVITSPATAVVCDNTPLGYTATSSTAGASFAWTRAVVPGIANPAGNGNTALINESLDNTTPNPVNVTYVITPSYGSCPGTPFNLVVTVNPTAVITSPATAVVCDNTPLGYTATSSTAGASFAWTRAVVPGIANPAGNGNTALINESLDNTTPNPVNVTYVITPSYGSCPGTPFNLVVTVNPTAVITSPATAVVCDNTPLGYTATSSTAGASFAWTRAVVPGIANPAGNGNTALINESLDNTTPNPVNVTYVITPSYGSCPGTPFNLVVTVNPTAVITSPATAVVCDNTPLGYTATSSTAGASFAWTRAVVPGIANPAGNGNTALINESLDNTTPNPVNVTYVITPSYGSCPGTPFNLVVTVNPTAVITSPATAVVCDNTPLGYTATSSTAGASFAWTRAVVPGIANPAGNGNTALINESLDNTTPNPVNVTYVITPSYGSCPGTPFNLVVTVNPTPILSSTLTPPPVCSNTVFSYTPLSNTIGTSFSWTRADVPGITPAGPVSGTDNPNEILRNITSAAIPVTYTYTLTANGCSNVQNVVVSIKPEPVISDQSASLCSGNTLDHKILLDNFDNPGDNVTFTWPEPVMDPGLSGGTARTIASSNNINDVFINVSGLELTAVYSVTPYYSGCTGAVKPITVHVGSEPVLDPNLNKDVCSGLETLLELKEAPGSVVPTGYNITHIYISTGLIADPGNSPVPVSAVMADYLKNHKFTNETGADKTVTYRVVPFFGASCIGDTVDVIVTIKPQPYILPAQNKTICSGSPVNKEILLVPANSPAGTLFNWDLPDMSDNSIQGSAGVNVTADPLGKLHITDILSNTSGSPITATYTIHPVSDFGCLGTPRDVVITVNPEPPAPVISGRVDLCTGETNIVYNVPFTAGSSYSWTVPASVGTKIFDFNTNAIIINSAVLPGSGNISVVETNSYNCSGPAGILPVQVHSPATVSLIAGNDSVCEFESGVYSVPFNAGSVYVWTYPAGTSLSGDPSSNSVTLTFGTISGNVIVRETNIAGCVTIHTPLYVTVSPLPAATISASKLSICTGEAVTFTAGPAGQANYEFFVDGVSAQTGASNIFTTNTLSNGQQVYVNVTTAANCSKSSTPLTINVFDNPVVTLSSSDADNIICAGTAVTFTAASATSVSYEFFRNGISVQNGPLPIYTVSTLANNDTIYATGSTFMGCKGISDSIVTIVNPLPAGVLSGDATICPGTGTNLQVSITAGTAPYIVELTNGIGPISGYNSNDPIPVSPSSSTVYSIVSLTDANSCTVTAPHANLTGTATVNLYENVSITAQPVITPVCEGTPLSISINTQGSGVTVIWQEDTGSGFANLSDLPGVYSGTNTNTLNLLNPASSMNGNFYRAFVSGTCPPSLYSDTVILTVYELPEIITPPASITRCEDDNAIFVVDEGVTTNPVFQWQLFNGASWVPVTGGQYNGVTDDTLVITGITSSLNNNQYRVVVSGTCTPSVYSSPATLTVNEKPEISLQPISVTQCEGLDATFTIATGVTTNPSIQWQVYDGATWLNASGPPYSGGTTLTLTASPVSSAMNGYQFRAVVSGSCLPNDTSNTVTLTVNELPEVTDPVSTTGCEGDTVFFEITTGATTNPAIQWQVSGDGSTWSNVSGPVYSGITSTRLNINGISTPLNGMFYRAVVSGACAPSASSAPAILTVKEKPEVTLQPVSIPVCEGESISYTINSGVTTNPAITWEVFNGSTWSIASGGPYSGTNTTTLTVNPVISAMNAYRFRAMVQGDCTPPVYSDEALLTVNEIPEITDHPNDTTVCEGRNASFSVNTGMTSGVSIIWQVDPNTGTFINVSGPPYSGENSPTLIINPTDSAMNGYKFRAIVSGICNPPVQSNEATLFIHQKPEILANPVDVIVCEDGSAIYTVDAGVTTSPTYLWEVNDGGSWYSASGIKYSGQGTGSLTVNNVTSGMSGYLYRVVVGGTCLPPVTSAPALLTVNEKPEILSHPQNETICEGDNTSFSVDPGVTTNPVYIWEVFDGTSWSLASGGVYSNETTSTLNLTNVPVSMNNYRFRVTVRGTCSPDITSNVATLTVNSRPNVTVDPVDVIACEGDTVSYKIEVVTSGPIFRWQVFNGSTWMNASGTRYTGANTDSLTINGVLSTMNNYRYRAIVSGICSPSDTSLEASLVVREKPEITAQPVSSVVCEGEPARFFVNAGVTTSPTYLWQVDTGSGFVTASIPNHSDYTTDTLRITGSASVMNGNLYRVIISGVCSPPVTSGIVSLTVNEIPEVISSPRDTTVCKGANITFKVNAGVTTNPSYQWKVFNGTTWSDVMDGSHYIGSTNPTLSVVNVDSAMTNYRYKAEISGICSPPVESGEATLIVNTAPLITQNPSDTVVCESQPATFRMQAVGTALYYAWQVDMNDGAGFNFISDTAGVYSGTGTSTLTVINPLRRFNNYKYRGVVSGACAPAKTTTYAVLTVSTPPEILVQPSPLTICEFSNASFMVSAQGTNLNYTWQESQGGAFTDLNDAGNYIGTRTQTVNIFNVPRTMNGWNYRVVIQGSCGPSVISDQVQLTVNTSPVITVHPADTTICEENGASFEVTAEGTNLVYEWQVSSGGAFSTLTDDTTYSGTTTNMLQITDAEPNINGYRYRVRVSGACQPAVFSNPALLYVNQNPKIILNPDDDEICENGFTNFTATATGPGLVYRWQVSSNGGSSWSDLNDDTYYSGTSSTTLTISATPVNFNANQYRLNVSNACIAVASTAAVLTVNANPTPVITGDGTFPLVCGGASLHLDGNPQGGSLNYTTHRWTGDIIPLDNANIRQPVFMTMINGIYNLIYTVTDSKGCKGSDTIAINNDRPNSQFVSDAVPSCGYLLVNFTNTSTRAVSYIWDFDDGGPTDNTENPSHGFDNYDPSGLVKYFNVKLIAESANGCRDTSNQYITIYPKIDPVFTVTPDSGCQPVVVTMITQPGAANYAWDFGDGQQQSAGHVILHEYFNLTNSIQNYTATLTTTSFYGCKASSSKTVKVYPIPQPNFSVTPIIQTYPSATINITNLVPSGPWTFEYKFGDGNTSTLPEPSHTYAEPGTYKIVQIVRTGVCVDSVEQTVIINPAVPVALFAEPPDGCTPHEVQFVNNSIYATDYLWDFGDGSYSTKRDPTYTYFEPGTYSVTLRATGPGGTDTYKLTLEVYATPRLDFSNFPDSVYVNDKPVKFFNLSGYATNYSWDFGDVDEKTGEIGADNTSTEFEPAHIYHTEGWKDVTLIGWNANCRDTLVVENAVLVRPAGRLAFPTVFRPNPNGPTGGRYSQDDPASNNSVFFPGIIDQVLEYHLYIYTRWGVQVFQSDDVLIGWDGYINGKLAKQGVYVWKVRGKYTNGKNFVEAGDITLLH